MSRPRRMLDDLPGPSGLGDDSQEDAQRPRDGGGPPPGPPQPRRAQPTPYVSFAVIAGAVVMFVLSRSLGRPLVIDGTNYGIVGPLALYGPWVQAGEYWRLLGMVFEHGGAMHLL